MSKWPGVYRLARSWATDDPAADVVVLAMDWEIYPQNCSIFLGLDYETLIYSYGRP